MNVTPEVVVFDLGKVLVDFDYSIAARKFAARGRIAAGEIQGLIDHSPLLFRYETGLITTEDFFREACALTGFSGELSDFRAIFSDIFSPINPMIELQQKLRGCGVRTCIFSNTNELAAGHIRRSFPFFSHFDRYILSYEHRAMKPDERIYRVVEKETGCTGRAILYLDDRAENIATGAQLGWQTILHHAPEASRARMAELGLPV